MQSLSVSDLQRNLHKLDEFNIIEIVDKRRNQIKGYFLDCSYKELIRKLSGEEKQKKNNLLKIVGILDEGSDDTRESLHEERLARYE